MTFGERVVRIRRTRVGTDPRYNEPVWEDVETPIPGAGVAPGPTEEPLVVDGQPATADAALYFFESSPDIVRTDRVRVRGKVYNVIGDPAEWVNAFTGWRAGLAVYLKRGEGS